MCSGTAYCGRGQSKLMRLQRGKIVIGICALAALPLLFSSPGRRESRAPVVNEAESALPQPSGQANHSLIDAQLRNGGLGPQLGEPFAAAVSPAIQPPASAATVAMSKPVPAPVSYRFAGTVSYQGKLRFLVTDGDRIYEVNAGDVLDGTYRVESADAEAVVVLDVPSGTTTRLATIVASSTPPSQQPRKLTFDAAAGVLRSDL